MKEKDTTVINKHGLKPCPFCGESEYVKVVRVGTNRQSCQVQCDECGCFLESNEIGSGDAWNSRVENETTSNKYEMITISKTIDGITFNVDYLVHMVCKCNPCRCEENIIIEKSKTELEQLREKLTKNDTWNEKI